MTNNDSQVQRALEIFPKLGVNKPNKPRVVFTSALQLDYDTEEQMTEYVIRRTELAEREQGRWRYNAVGSTGIQHNGQYLNLTETTDFDAPFGDFMSRRDIWDCLYRNDVWWRKAATCQIEGSIWDESNVSTGTIRRITRQAIAKSVARFFGVDPWFAAYPVGPSDAINAEKVEKHARWKLEQSGVKPQLESGIERAAVIGEAVMKTTYRRHVNVFDSFEDVLIDPISGEPVRTYVEPNQLDSEGNPVLGELIFRSDSWVPVQIPLDPYNPMAGVSEIIVLKKDQKTPRPPDEAMIYVNQLVEKTEVVFDGVETFPIHHRDFLCPLTSEDIYRADFCCHLYDEPLMDTIDSMVRTGFTKGTNKGNIQEIKNAVELLNSSNTGSTDPTSGRNQPRYNLGEIDNKTGDENPTMEIIEAYFRYDPKGDGVQREIMMKIDRKTRRPIFYDYVNNVTPKGRRPFEVIVFEKVVGRWYGLGVPEKFFKQQMFMDLCLNRINFRLMGMGRITGWHPERCVEGRNNPDLKVNDGTTYTLLDNWKLSDLIETMQLDDDVSGLSEQMQLFLQFVTNEAGVMSANDAQTAGLDSSETATGINQITTDGDEIFGTNIMAIQPGLANCIKTMVRLIYSNLNEREVFQYAEGDIQFFDAITPEEVRDLDLNIEVLLAKDKGPKQLESAKAAFEAFGQYLSIPDPYKPNAKPMTDQIMKALNIQNADQITRLPTPMQQENPPNVLSMAPAPDYTSRS